MTSGIADQDPSVGTPYEDSAYRRWIREQGLTPLEAHHVPDLRSVELEDWAAIGARGRIISHDDSDRSNDSQLVRLAPHSELLVQRHLFDKMVYVLDGSGTTSVWNSRGDRQTFDWSAAALFALPMNVSYVIKNTGDVPALLVCVTNAPIALNLYDDTDFVFGSDYDFLKRFQGEEGYFNGEGTVDGRQWSGHHVINAKTFPLIPYPERGAGGANVKLKLARSAQWAHISQFPVGTYKKAHRHGPGANVVVLSGQGYTMMWRQNETPRRYDWREGSLVVPPENWFHQHFNTGTEPARYLALRHSRAARHAATGLPLTSVSTRLGGDQIEYEDEDEVIRTTYDQALAENGVQSRMPR